MIVTDGGRGDSDNTANGTISVTSAMSLNSDEGSGSISLLHVLFLTVIFFLARYSERGRLSRVF